jgi:hypothetical protein
VQQKETVMPTEAELREQFHDDDRPSAHHAIDLDAVLRRSRARRRPRVGAAAIVGSLAVLAIVVPVGVSVAAGQTGLFSASSGSASSADDGGGKSAPESLAGGSNGGAVDGAAPVQKVNLCTGALARLAPAANGLILTVGPVEAAATDRDIQATVTLTNSGTAPFTGSASPFPVLTLSRDGIVLWHSNGAVPSLAAVIDLAPGASMSFPTTFEPLVCGAADDERTSFREDLPATGPGTYGLSAVLGVSSDDGASVLVSGPVAVVELH